MLTYNSGTYKDPENSSSPLQVVYNLALECGQTTIPGILPYVQPPHKHTANPCSKGSSFSSEQGGPAGQSTFQVVAHPSEASK